MYRFIRTATVKNSAYTPQAMGFATELTGWMNKKYDVNLIVGTELFGELRIHWHFDTPNLATIDEFNNRLIVDKEYWTWLEKGREYWVEGSVHDTIVKISD